MNIVEDGTLGIKVRFVDGRREPQCPPNPRYPEGRDIDISEGRPSCKVDIPYPAPRCGLMMIECEDCDFKMGVTVAGRIDDPKTVRFPCPKKVN